MLAMASKADLDAVTRELDALCPGIAKTKPLKRRRAEQNADALELFRKGIDLIDGMKLSRDKLAARLNCTSQFIDDVYNDARDVPAWILLALPEVQVEIAKLRVVQLSRKTG